MTVGSFKTFNYVYQGLVLEVTAEDLGGGQTSFTVKCLEGYADINALYWTNGVVDGNQFDLSTKKDNSLSMNGTGEDWDGGVILSSTGLGSDGLEKPTYLTAGESYTKVEAVDWATLDTFGIRATSTSTAEGSIKAVDNEPVITGQAGRNLFTENFDGYGEETQTTYQDNGVNVFASVDLNAASGWTGTGSNPATSELGADGYGGIEATSGGADGFWFDTMNSPGPVSIANTFTDTTAAEGGVTSVLSFDIAKQDLTYQGNPYVTDPDATFEFRIDGQTVATVEAADLANSNEMYHFEIELAGYAQAGAEHTIEMVDTTGQSGFTGFAIDSIEINDWII
jgi:hypothetical protein